MSLEQKYKAAMLATAGPWQKTHGLDPNGTYQGTCQACFGGFVVKNVGNKNKLVTVLHGYERPGHGYIEGECPGRGEEPFEVDKTITEQFKEKLKHILESSKKHLDQLQRDEVDKLFIHIKTPSGEKRYETIKRGWINPNKSYDNFEQRRQNAISDTKGQISQIDSNLSFTLQKLDGWKYSPQALKLRVPQNQVPPSQLTGKAWYDHPDIIAAMRKMPSPEARGTNFREWAETFPHVLLWMGMNGRRTPSYYDKIKDTFAKQPGVKTTLISAVVRKTQQLDDTKIEKEKLVKSQLDTFMNHPQFVAFLKSRRENVSIYNAGNAEPAQPGEKTLFDRYQEKITRAESHPNFTDRQYSMKRIVGDFKDLADDYGAKVKIKLPRAQKKA